MGLDVLFFIPEIQTVLRKLNNFEFYVGTRKYDDDNSSALNFPIEKDSPVRKYYIVNGLVWSFLRKCYDWCEIAFNRIQVLNRFYNITDCSKLPSYCLQSNESLHFQDWENDGSKTWLYCDKIYFKNYFIFSKDLGWAQVRLEYLFISFHYFCSIQYNSF